MSSRRPPLAERVALPRPETQGDGALYRSFLDWDWRVRGRKLQKWHHYFDIYERHLSRFRGTDCHLLEFGVMDGGSLFMWREFLGPGARITAVDIDPRTLQFNGLLPNVTVVTGDQADQAVLDRIVAEHGPFDIAIDDGGHTARQQINTFNGIYASVVADGVYICEDTHTSYWPEYQDAGPQTTMIEHAKKLVDEMHSVYRAAKPSRFSVPMAERQGDIAVSRFAASTYSIQFYDSMIVFEKRPRAEPWSEFR